MGGASELIQFDLNASDIFSSATTIHSSDDGFRLSPELLDGAIADAGRPVKALLFTSPNNPLGTVYTAEEINEALAHGTYNAAESMRMDAEEDLLECQTQQ